MRNRVIVLSGPSGSGKSRLAARLHEAHGWPLVRLDDFYRDHDDPGLPRDEALDIVDWDDPGSWNGAAALVALTELVDTGRAATPVYDISTSQRVGSSEITAAPTDLIVAEGIFAAELIEPLRRAGLLHSAWCVVHRHRALTFLWRLTRDLKEHRKPPHILVRRGWTLLRDEPALIRRQVALGSTCATAATVAAAVESTRP